MALFLLAGKFDVRNIAMLLIVGLAVGFFSTLILLPESNNVAPARASATFPVDIDLGFSARKVRQGTLGAGWEKTEQWGVWAKEVEAVVFAQLLGAVGGEIILFLEGRGRPDLPAHGLPAGAGFDIILPQPLDPAQETDVLFPNEKPLGKSPCHSS